jgi:hypothetical protein
MKRLVAVVGCGVELALLVGLCGYLSAANAFVYCVAFLLYALLVVIQWRELTRSNVAQKVLLRLCFLTGPCVYLSMVLVLVLSCQLKGIAMGASKEMVAAAHSDGVPNQCYDQWFKDRVERMKSERLICLMLLASTGLYYANLRASSCRSSSREEYDDMSTKSSGTA